MSDLLVNDPASYQLEQIFETHNFTPRLIAKFRPSSFNFLKDDIHKEMHLWEDAWVDFYSRELPILMGNDLLTLKDRAFLALHPGVRNRLSDHFELGDNQTLEEFLLAYRRRHFTPQCDFYGCLRANDIEGALQCANGEYVMAHLEFVVRVVKNGFGWDRVLKWIRLAIKNLLFDVADAILDSIRPYMDPIKDFVLSAISEDDDQLLEYLFRYLGDDIVTYLNISDNTEYNHQLWLASEYGHTKVLRVLLLKYTIYCPQYKQLLLRSCTNTYLSGKPKSIKVHVEFMDLDDIRSVLAVKRKFNKPSIDAFLKSGKIPNLNSLLGDGQTLKLPARTIAFVKAYFKKLEATTDSNQD